MKTGDLVLLSSGEYSEYGIRKVVRALKDADAERLVESYLQEYPEDRGYEEANGGVAGQKFDRFIAWMVRDGLVEPLDYHEFYLGSWSTFQPEELCDEDE